MADDTRRWRIGSRYGIHVYAVTDGQPFDFAAGTDTPVCTAMTVAFAKQIVADHNIVRDKLLGIAAQSGEA